MHKQKSNRKPGDQVSGVEPTYRGYFRFLDGETWYVLHGHLHHFVYINKSSHETSTRKNLRSSV